jgi:hypothetical protein
VLAGLGPNTTYHTTSLSHVDQTDAVRNTDSFALPDDTKGESWMTFGADAKVSAFSSVVEGLDGHVYQRSDLVKGHLIITDVATGQTQPAGDYDGVTVDDIRRRVSEATEKVIATIGPLAAAKKTTINGTPAYVIETASNRTYVDQTHYQLLRSEQLASDGHVTGYSMPTVEEVLNYVVAFATVSP